MKTVADLIRSNENFFQASQEEDCRLSDFEDFPLDSVCGIECMKIFINEVNDPDNACWNAAYLDMCEVCFG